MDLPEVRRRLLTQCSIRVEPEMGRYVAKRLAAQAPGSGPARMAIMGVHARTGVAVRQEIDLAPLMAPEAGQ